MIHTKSIVISKPTAGELVALGLVLAGRVILVLLIPRGVDVMRTIYETWHHL
jgi:hypothetical protein